MRYGLASLLVILAFAGCDEVKPKEAVKFPHFKAGSEVIVYREGQNLAVLGIGKPPDRDMFDMENGCKARVIADDDSDVFEMREITVKMLDGNLAGKVGVVLPSHIRAQ